MGAVLVVMITNRSIHPTQGAKDRPKKGVHPKSSLVNQCVQWGHFQEHGRLKGGCIPENPSQHRDHSQEPHPRGSLCHTSGLPAPSAESSAGSLLSSSHGCLSHLGTGTCEPRDFQDYPETCKLYYLVAVPWHRLFQFPGNSTTTMGWMLCCEYLCRNPSCSVLLPRHTVGAWEEHVERHM